MGTVCDKDFSDMAPGQCVAPGACTIGGKNCGAGASCCKPNGSGGVTVCIANVCLPDECTPE